MITRQERQKGTAEPVTVDMKKEEATGLRCIMVFRSLNCIQAFSNFNSINTNNTNNNSEHSLHPYCVLRSISIVQILIQLFSQ